MKSNRFKLLSSIFLIVFILLLNINLNKNIVHARTDYNNLNIWGGEWTSYPLPNGGNQDEGWNKPEFKKDGVRLIENELIGDNNKKYMITTGTQLPVYSSGIGGYRTHTIEGHFVKDMASGKEDYYTSRGCINNVSYCAESDHGMHSGTPGNNSFMRYQMDNPEKNFSALNACGPSTCTFAHIKHSNNRYFLKITTYPTNHRDLRQEVVSTVGDEGEILTYVRILNNMNKRIPHIRIGAEITLGSGESYSFTGTGFNGLNIKALDANNNRNLPKYFKPISGAKLYATNWDNNNIDDITQDVNSAQCKDLGTVVNQGKARGLYFIADKTSIEASDTIEFSYMTSFRSEKTPDNVVHKTYVDQETGNVFTKEDQRGSSCGKYAKDIKEIKGYEFVNTSGDPASGTFDGEPKNVTYHYKRKTLVATARYVDENGNVIASETSTSGKYGERVTLNSKDIYGYRYKRWSGYSASGNGPTAQITILDATHSTATGKENVVTFHYEKKKEFTILLTHYLNEGIGGNLKVEEINVFAEDYYDLNDYLLDMPGIKFVKADHDMYFQMPYNGISITLTYEKITTKITVKFVDDLNRKIADDVVYEGKYEKTQKIAEKQITGYFIDPNKTQPSLNQVFGLQDKVITFYYDRQTVTFNVIHKDEKGNILEQKQVEYKYLDEYDESTKLDNDDYIFVKDSNNTKGIVALNQKDVVLEYRKKIETSISVKYVNEKNEVLDTLIINGKEGDTYTIPKKDFTGYKFKSSSESLSGVFNDKNKEVTLVYELIDVTITINYLEEINKDNILAEKTLVKGKYGEAYTLPDPKIIDNYIFVRINGDRTGTFKTNTEVSYFYRRPKDSQIKVQYYNDANKKLDDDVIIYGKEGQPYETEQKEFEGHTFKEYKGDSPSGIFGTAGKTITYIYSRNEYGVNIKYIDMDSNSVIEQVEKRGKYDTKYTSEAKEFDDYILVTIPDNANGTYKVENDDVIYLYRLRKNFEISIKHIDDRNQVFYEESKQGKEGEAYITEQTNIPGYILMRVEGEPEGIFDGTTKEVIYYYDRVKTKITLKHLNIDDKDGEQIANDIIITNKYDDIYEVTPQLIKYYDFIEADQALEGNHGLENKTINLYYKQKDGQVKVKYVDDRNKILEEKIINGKQGSTYSTEQKAFDGYIFDRVEGQPSGIIDENNKEIVYYYDRIKTKIILRHLNIDNKDGEPLVNDIVIENKYEEEYNIIPIDIIYYNFIEADQALEGNHGLENKTINLYYKQKDGQVKVKYVDDRNKILKEKIIKGKQGSTYSTEQKAFAGYIFDRVEGQPSGIIDENNKEIVYYYNRIKTKIILRHLNIDNKDGEPLVNDIVIENKYEEEYNIIPIDIIYYNFIEADQALEGNHGLENKTINLYYKQKDGQVKVKYVDDRNKILEEKIINGKQGSTYSTEQKAFAGYIFDRVEGQPSGIIDENNKEIVYYYDRIKTKITIKHFKKQYDKKSNEIIAEDVVIINKYDEEYNHQPQDIINYNFVESDKELTGRHGLEDIEISLFYELKDSQIKVKYMDDRNKVLDEMILNGKLGESYITNQKDFKGYIFDTIIGDSKGVFKDEKQEVVYKYDRVKSKIIFKHIAYIKSNIGSKVIADDYIIENKYEEKYQYTPKVIPNYKFISSESLLRGEHGVDDQVIFLVYKDNNVSITNPSQNNNNDNSLEMLPVTGNQYLNISITLIFTTIISCCYLHLKRIS